MDGDESVWKLDISNINKQKLNKASFHSISEVKVALENGTLRDHVHQCGEECEKIIRTAIDKYYLEIETHKQNSSDVENSKNRKFKSSEGKKNRRTQLIVALLLFLGVVIAASIPLIAPDHEQQGEPNIDSSGMNRKNLLQTSLKVLDFPQEVFLIKLREAKKGGTKEWRDFRTCYAGYTIQSWNCAFVKVLGVTEDSEQQGIVIDYDPDDKSSSEGSAFFADDYRTEEIHYIKRGMPVFLEKGRIARIYEDATFRLEDCRFNFSESH